MIHLYFQSSYSSLIDELKRALTYLSDSNSTDQEANFAIESIAYGLDSLWASPLTESVSRSGHKLMVETPSPFRLLAMLAFPADGSDSQFSSELDKYAMTFDTRLKSSNSP
jgi:hypothetical protein